MANPSLKAQIEAAKSALASDLAAPSLVTPHARNTPTASNMAIAHMSNTMTQFCHQLRYAANPFGTIPADCKSAHATNAAALDEAHHPT